MKQIIISFCALMFLSAACNNRPNSNTVNATPANNVVNEQSTEIPQPIVKGLSPAEWSAAQAQYNFTINIPGYWRVQEVTEGQDKGFQIFSPAGTSLDSVEIFPAGRKIYGYASSYEVNKPFLTRVQFAGKSAEQYITTSYRVIHIFNPPGSWGTHPNNMVSGNYQDDKATVDAIIDSFKFTD